MKTSGNNTLSVKTENLRALYNEKDLNPEKNFGLYIKKNLLEEGAVFHFPENLDFNDFVLSFQEWFTKNNYVTEIAIYNDVVEIKYHSKSIKTIIGLNNNYFIYFFKFETWLVADIKPNDWLTKKEPKFSIKNWLSDSDENIIYRGIHDIFENQYKLTKQLSSLIENNKYTCDINICENTLLYQMLETQERILVLLEISEIKSGIKKAENKEKTKIFYIVTTLTSGIIIISEKSELIGFTDLKNNQLKVKKEIGRNTVNVTDIVFLTTLSNDDYFTDIQNMAVLTEDEKIRETARLNWLKNNKSQSAIDFCSVLIDKYKDPLDQLTLFYICTNLQKTDEIENIFLQNEKLTEIIKQTIAQPNASEKLPNWFKNWDIPSVIAFQFIKIFTNICTTANESDILLPTHTQIRERFFEKNSDKLNLILFDAEYCKHLIKSNKLSEAEKILTDRISDCPDESLLDLLSPENLKTGEKEKSTKLKIILYELLEQTQNGESKVKTLHELVLMQPLAHQKRHKLAEIAPKELAEKINAVNEISTCKFSQPVKSEPKIEKLKPFAKSDIEKYIPYPATRKGNAFDYLQNWLAKVEIPDLNQLKTFSRPFDNTKYATIAGIITDIKYLFGITNLELYIGQGEKSKVIRAFEANPSFLMIGEDLLNESSPYFMPYNELKFTIAAEIAHLYFKQSRITATDVWRGAIEKSIWAIDTFSKYVPMLGFLTKILPVYDKIKPITNFLLNEPGNNSSKDILNLSQKISEIILATNKQNTLLNTEHELIAVSRIMQLTADRAGLVFAEDIFSAIRCIILTSGNVLKELDVIDKYGLFEFLQRNIETGNNPYPDFTVRITHILSFYLSDEYDIIKKMKKN